MSLRLSYRLWLILEPRERRNALLVLGVVILSAIGAAAMVGSIMPFLAVLADPEVIHADGYLARIYDALGFQSDFRFLVALGLASIAVILVAGLLQIARSYAVARFAAMRIHSLSSRLLIKYLNYPYEYFLDLHSSRISTQILEEARQVVNSFLRPLVDLVASALTILSIVLLVLVLHPFVALITFVVFGVICGGIFALSRRLLNRVGHRLIAANRQRFQIITEAFAGVKYLKLAGLEKSYANRFSNPSRVSARSQALTSVLGEVPQYTIQTLAFTGGIAICLSLLTPANMASGETLGSLVPTIGLFAAAAMRILPELGRAYRGLAWMQTTGPAVAALCEELTRDSTDTGSLKEKIPLRKTLTLRDATYRYPSSTEGGIRNVSLVINAGETVGIVGTTGAGKTTLADVLLGLLQPQTGALLVDDSEVSEANVKAWQRSVAYVPQDIVLVDASVAENVALGIPCGEIDLERVRRAAVAACIDEHVSSLPQGYDTTLGERAIRLSGGQRQRIGVARALYRDADLLVLDEATSALDTRTERRVITRTHKLPGNKTILMIAHRLTTLRVCDRIIVMKDGRIHGFGTWEELSATDTELQLILNSAEAA